MSKKEAHETMSHNNVDRCAVASIFSPLKYDFEIPVTKFKDGKKRKKVNKSNS